MRRLAAPVCTILICLLAVTVSAEIVKVVVPKVDVYDGEKKLSFNVEGKRFMVYGARSGWYLIQATLNKQTKYLWVQASDVVVDWGKAEVKTTTVASLYNVNTLRLADGTLVQFRRIFVPMEDTPLKRQTETWLRGVLEGKEVTLEFETRGQNRHGYREAYVYVDGAFLNRTLVQSGLARVPFSTDKGRYDAVLASYAKQARDAGLGIWKQSKDETEAQARTEDNHRTESAPEPVVARPTRPRELTPAQRQQWDLRLQIEVKILSERLAFQDDDGPFLSHGGPMVDGHIAMPPPRQKEYDGLVPVG